MDQRIRFGLSAAIALGMGFGAGCSAASSESGPQDETVVVRSAETQDLDMTSGIAQNPGKYLYLGDHGASTVLSNKMVSDGNGLILPAYLKTNAHGDVIGTLDPVAYWASHHYQMTEVDLPQGADPRTGADSIIQTLTDWKRAFGFPPRVKGETLQAWRDRTGVVVYYNRYDLGLGRELGCSTFRDSDGSAGFACFVTNYGPTFGNFAKGMADTVPGLRPKNTVCITYRPYLNAKYPNLRGSHDVATNFYVFDGAGKTQDWAQLDNMGPRLFPQICTNCHSGTFDKNSGLVFDARFLPLNPGVLAFADDPGSGFTPSSLAAGLKRGGQMERIRQVNLLASQTSLTQPQRDYLLSMYANNTVSPPGLPVLNGLFVPGATPPQFPAAGNWASLPGGNGLNVYQNVVGPLCAGCHLAMPAAPGQQSVLDYTIMRALAPTVLCPTTAMPQSEQALARFWDTQHAMSPPPGTTPSTAGIPAGKSPQQYLYAQLSSSQLGGTLVCIPSLSNYCGSIPGACGGPSSGRACGSAGFCKSALCQPGSNKCPVHQDCFAANGTCANCGRLGEPACVAGTTTGPQGQPARPACAEGTNSGGYCVECQYNFDCNNGSALGGNPEAHLCDTASHTCQACLASADCGSNKACATVNASVGVRKECIGTRKFVCQLAGTCSVPGDVDKDGKADLMVVGGPADYAALSGFPLASRLARSFTSGTLGAFSNPTLSYDVPSFVGWASASGVVAVDGDFNGDGYADVALVSTNPANGWLSIPIAFSGPAGSTFHVTNEVVPSFPGWAQIGAPKVLSGDFNGDGRSDIAIFGGTAGNWGSIAVVYSNGDGTFSGPTNQTPSPRSGNSGDGYDFAVSWAETAGVQALAGDFDGDHLTDIALVGGPTSSPFNDSIPIAFSNGDGTFVVVRYPAVAWLPTSDPAYSNGVSFVQSWTHGSHAIAGDFNGDGLTDIALTGVSGWASIPVAFARDRFSFRVSNLSVSYFPWWATLAAPSFLGGDFNGDGLSDIAITGSPVSGGPWGSIAVAISQGDGHFRAENVGGAGAFGFATETQATGTKAIGAPY